MHETPVYGAPTFSELLRLRDVLVNTTEQMARMAQDLLAAEAWDLFFVVFGATHRGGHYLWDRSQVESDGASASSLREVDDALVDVYVACDAALARLIESAPDSARILVFAVHGMEPNAAWNHIVEDLLGRIQQVRRSRVRTRPARVSSRACGALAPQASGAPHRQSSPPPDPGPYRCGGPQWSAGLEPDPLLPPRHGSRRLPPDQRARA